MFGRNSSVAAREEAGQPLKFISYMEL
jgi:hypothetical protein